MKLVATLSFCLLFSFIAQSQIIYLKAVLEGSQEVPSTGSTATGVVIVKYNTATKLLDLIGDFQDLSGVITDAHIHGPAPVGVNAGVLLPLAYTNRPSASTGMLSTATTFTLAQETDLLAGNMYVNVHSTVFPAGEIRGQLTTTTSGQTDLLHARIQGAQQVPPNGSLARGSLTTLLDKGTGMLYLTGTYSNLSTIPSSCQMHTGAPNTTGSVFINLKFSLSNSGTIHVASPITPANQALMISGNTYVNLRAGTYPIGEIRGQITMESQIVYLKAVLKGSQEVPANASGASGTTIVKYNTATRVLELIGDYQNITAPITAAHIHSPAPAGTNAGILFPLNNTSGITGVLSLVATLTPAQEMELLNGLMYVNVHNALFPGGEIRGQLTPTNGGGQTYFLTGIFSGLQQVPSNASTGTGTVKALLDKISNEVFVTGDFHNISASAQAAHIHKGQAGVNGPVVVPLIVNGDTSGTVTGSAVVRSSFADSMILGLTYINIHNILLPDGEIRAQLGNIVLPVKLTYFNGYKQGNKIALIWESAMELNLRQYEIEQQDPVTGKWIYKGSIASQNGNTAAKYSFLDIPLAGSNYVIYRLKMTDNDGKLSYSPAVRINFKVSQAALSILTNPVLNGQLQYVITGLPTNKKVEVSIVDYGGRVMSKGRANSLGNNTISVGKLASGMYKLIVQVDGNILQQSFTR